MAAPIPEPARSVSLRLAFAPEPSGVREVSVAIRNFLAEQGVCDADLFAFELCVAEASNNAVEYGEGPARKLNAVAEAILTPAQIELRVIDHTPGFVLPERIAPPSPMNDRGRGLFLIQSVMDELRYFRGPNENVLVMLKKRRPGPAWDSARAGSSGNGKGSPEADRDGRAAGNGGPGNDFPAQATD